MRSRSLLSATAEARTSLSVTPDVRPQQHASTTVVQTPPIRRMRKRAGPHERTTRRRPAAWTGEAEALAPLLLSVVDNQHSEGPLLLTVSGIEAYHVKRAGQTDWLLQRLGSAPSMGTPAATCASRRGRLFATDVTTIAPPTLSLRHGQRPGWVIVTAGSPVQRRRGPARDGQSDWHRVRRQAKVTARPGVGRGAPTAPLREPRSNASPRR
jgi:hypothetical protein